MRPSLPSTVYWLPTLLGLTLAASVGLGLLTGCGGGEADTGGAQGSTSAASATTRAAEATDEPFTLDTRASAPSRRELLGRAIFNDPALSEPPGTACVSCHGPARGHADNHGTPIGVALGSRPGSLGLRNSLANAYGATVPAFGFAPGPQGLEPRGGHFWDGRADTLAQQALGPLLNPLEMNNPSVQAVVQKIASAAYAPAFAQEFGADIFNRPAEAFAQIGAALEAFEKGPALQPYTSRYDAMVRGQIAFTAAEQRGLALFMDRQRANCVSCHQAQPGSGRPEDSLFTHHGYFATGIPRNRLIPRNADPAFFDLGLCGPERAPPQPPAGLAAASLCGKFRVPSLRNVALRDSLMHNGFFHDLAEVVRFYSTRSSQPERWWGPAAVPNDLPAAYRANLEAGRPPFNRPRGAAPLLSDAEVSDLVAFLRALNDGFTP